MQWQMLEIKAEGCLLAIHLAGGVHNHKAEKQLGIGFNEWVEIRNHLSKIGHVRFEHGFVILTDPGKARVRDLISKLKIRKYPLEEKIRDCYITPIKGETIVRCPHCDFEIKKPQVETRVEVYHQMKMIDVPIGRCFKIADDNKKYIRTMDTTYTGWGCEFITNCLIERPTEHVTEPTVHEASYITPETNVLVKM